MPVGKAALKRLVKPAGIAVSLLGLYFLFSRLDPHLLLQTMRQVGSRRFALLVAAYALGVGCTFAGWGMLLKPHVQGSVSLRRVLRIYARGVMAKYLPGNVFQYVSRQFDLAQHGVAHRQTALITVYEIASQAIAAGLLVGLSALMWWPPMLNLGFLPGPLPVRLLASVLLAGSVVLAIGGLFKIRNFAFSLLLHAGFLLIFETVGHAMIHVVSPGASVPVGMLALAWLVGFVVIGAPGGIGVREGMLIVLLSPMLGHAAATLAVQLRLLTVCGDLLFFGVSCLGRWRKMILLIPFRNH